MSGALFPRVKTWGTTDTVTAADLNAEFDNILNNFLPTMMQGYSVNATQMQIQTSPGAVGSESLATALSGELERLRFQIAAMSGTTFWYQLPPASITSLNNALGAAAQANKISTGLTQATTGMPLFLVPDGTTNRVTAAGLSTPLVYSVTSATYTISTNVTLSGLTVATTTGNTCLVTDTSITAGQTWTQLLGENGSTISIGTVGAAVTAQAGKLVAFKTPAGTAEYFIGRLNATATAINDCYRGYFFSSANANIARQNLTNGDTLTLMQLTWVYATTAGSLVAGYTNPTYAATAPSSPSIADYWFDMTNNLWKTYNGSSWVASGSTLIGTCIQDSTKTVGARSLDFYANYQTTNDIEVFVDGNSIIRGRYLGSQISVQGLPVIYTKNYPTWGTTLDEGGSIAASTFYYLYISNVGNTLITAVAPHNRPDLLGYYHPAAMYRCVGYVYVDASTHYGEIESFYKAAPDFAVSTITAAVASYPRPFIVPPKQQLIECNAAAGAITQVLPHPSQWKSQRLIYTKTDSSTNAVTLQAWGNSVLTTTANLTQGNTNVGTLGANTGLSTGITYLISGAGIPWGTTATWASGSTATLSQNCYFTTTGTNVTFATTPVGSGIFVGTATTIGQFTIPLATQNETVELMSDGANIIVLAHNIPSPENWVSALTITGSTTNPTKGATTYENFVWRRDGDHASWRWDAKWAAGSAGTGDYQIALPSPINNIDLTKVQALASVIGATYPNTTFSAIGTGFENIGNGTSAVALIPYVMSATQFKVILVGNGVWAGGVAGNLAGATTITIIGRHPVSGWWL